MQLEPPNPDDHDRPENRPVTVREARSEFEASMIVSILADVGIEAHAFDRFRQALPFHSHFSGIPIQVRASDAEAAKQALAQRVADSIDIDWDEVDVREREDRLPLRPLGTMPLGAKVALAFVLLGLALMLALAFLMLIL